MIDKRISLQPRQIKFLIDLVVRKCNYIQREKIKKIVSRLTRNLDVNEKKHIIRKMRNLYEK